MKVVLFCGGLGMRMGETSSRVPKPMITIGDRPILWHIMKYYSSFGITDFVLGLGYKADAIKQYFLDYNEAIANDFVLRNGKHVELLRRDIDDWSMTFVDTGLNELIGQRLMKMQQHVGDDEFFLATYGDGLTDAPLSEMIATLAASDAVGLFLAARPTHNFHLVTFDGENRVETMHDVTKADLWVNAGFFVFRREIFEYIRAGEDLVEEPFHRLIEEQKLIAYPYEGFWAPMDTLKDKQWLENLHEAGSAPWELWNPDQAGQRDFAHAVLG
jgi:glucose-1-phosphate cytidylyltransferase